MTWLWCLHLENFRLIETHSMVKWELKLSSCGLDISNGMNYWYTMKWFFWNPIWNSIYNLQWGRMMAITMVKVAVAAATVMSTMVSPNKKPMVQMLRPWSYCQMRKSNVKLWQMIYHSLHLKTLISKRLEPCMERLKTNTRSARKHARSTRKRATSAACANLLLSANGCWHFIDSGISPKSHTNAAFARQDSVHVVNASCIWWNMQNLNDMIPLIR